MSAAFRSVVSGEKDGSYESKAKVSTFADDAILATGTEIPSRKKELTPFLCAERQAQSSRVT